MRIKFTGYVDFPETPDDRGSVDHWLCMHLSGSCMDTDELMESLNLTWEEVDARDTNS